MTKDKLRRLMRARRADAVANVGIRLAGHVLSTGLIPAAAVVGGFWPLLGEIDVRALMVALVGRGHVVALPVTPARGTGLSFRRWRPGTRLRAGRFGTMEPAASETVMPTVLLVPLLAFDRCGRRLGYGGGYYDRTLADTGARAIGCGFALQEVDRIPTEPHDRVLNAVATEASVVVME